MRNAAVQHLLRGSWRRRWECAREGYVLGSGHRSCFRTGRHLVGGQGISGVRCSDTVFRPGIGIGAVHRAYSSWVLRTATICLFHKFNSMTASCGSSAWALQRNDVPPIRTYACLSAFNRMARDLPPGRVRRSALVVKGGTGTVGA